MKFLDNNLFLESDISRELFHGYASKMPVVDFHDHLDANEIFENKNYANITQLWLKYDHYKWRAMRTCGIDEQFIKGNAPDDQKFKKWAETLPRIIGNPLYIWTHLELKRYFGIDEVLAPESADRIYEQCNELLKKTAFKPRSLINRSRVEVLCTTDDPADDLSAHQKLHQDHTFQCKVLPTFRPDKYLYIERPCAIEKIEKLGTSAGIKIKNFDDLLESLYKRMDFFNSFGCRASDHSLEPVEFENTSHNRAADIFKTVLAERIISHAEAVEYRSFLLTQLAKKYSELGWVMQLHMGVLRNTNTSAFKSLGPDSGFDTMGDKPYLEALACFLNQLEKNDYLPRTVLYNIDPRDNNMLAALTGSFQRAPLQAKVQLGPAWWFNDTITGILNQLVTFTELGALGSFIGMTTDSRSLLSFSRHEYFRRILCNMIGTWAEKGEIPSDIQCLGKFVIDISYNNARNFFGMGK